MPGRAGSWGVGAVLIGALAIVLGSAGLGVAVNHWSPRGIPLLPKEGEERLPLPAGLEAIGPDDARQAFEEKSALFVDARTPEEYEEAHIPGAVNLPPEEFEDRLLDTVEEVEAARSVVVYCSSEDCGDAIQTAERLLEVVTVPIKVVENGWRAWQEAGYPTTEGAEP